ncbi:hypothetical protein ACO0M4_40095 [Streptomyces sp. RGM 3693]|uniref:hypothetical protein n=1 Tax=Streptomyces sp. RGM 3693 TaxID=3413284 RepID=UPI003D2DA036
MTLRVYTVDRRGVVTAASGEVRVVIAEMAVRDARGLTYPPCRCRRCGGAPAERAPPS